MLFVVVALRCWCCSSAGPKGRLLLDMRGAAADAGGCCFRRRGEGRRVPSAVAAAAAGLCLLPVAGAVDGAVMFAGCWSRCM